MAKIPTFYCDWLRSLKLEKGQLFELLRREGGVKIHRSAQKCYAICWSIIKYLLSRQWNRLFEMFTYSWQKYYWCTQNAKMLLMHPECKNITDAPRMWKYYWCTQNVKVLLMHSECANIVDAPRMQKYYWCTKNANILLMHPECENITDAPRMRNNYECAISDIWLFFVAAHIEVFALSTLH